MSEDLKNLQYPYVQDLAMTAPLNVLRDSLNGGSIQVGDFL
jgi:hypothetical protein